MNSHLISDLKTLRNMIEWCLISLKSLVSNINMIIKSKRNQIKEIKERLEDEGIYYTESQIYQLLLECLRNGSLKKTWEKMKSNK